MKIKRPNAKGRTKKLHNVPLSPHFTLAQFLYSKTAKKLGIDNTPSKKVVKNLRRLAAGLERVRRLLGYPITITSGFRCRRLNAAVGGSKTSHHMLGLAADFTCERYGSSYLACKKIGKSDIVFDQLIHEYGASKDDQWIHLSFGPKNRREKLTICASKGVYLKGFHRHLKK
jgi:zinc D-Ala-D-Ala carboxypeptidase